MRVILFLAMMVSALSANAGWYLKPYLGHMTNFGGLHRCTFKNNTADSLDMKYVVFSVEHFNGRGSAVPQQERIDHVVRSGEDVSYSVLLPGFDRVTSCAYLAR